MNKFARTFFVLILVVAMAVTSLSMLVGCKKETEEVNYYIVTFLDWDGTELQVNKVQEGGMVHPPQNLSRKDEDGVVYAFEGWDRDLTNIHEDMVVRAMYKGDKHNRVFFIVDGKVIQVQKSGDSFTIPTPSKEGYVFLGWGMREDIEDVVEITYVTFSFLSSDVNVYARFMPQSEYDELHKGDNIEEQDS